jgi:hypothetical protein
MKGHARLLNTLERADLAPPSDLRAAVEALPPAGAMPPPWDVWAFFAAVEYGRRQRRALGMLEGLVVPEVEARTGCHAPLEEIAARGHVPGHPEWEFEVEPGQATLSHRGDGEVIVVDTSNWPGVFGEGSFAEALLSHARPGPATLRLLELHPGLHTLPLALRDVSRAGLLHPVIPGHYDLCPEAWKAAGRIGAFLAAWRGRPDRRIWLAALIGDWQAAHEAACLDGDPDLVVLTGPRAERCRQLRLERLRRHIAARGPCEETLRGLAAAGAEDLPQHLRRALKRRDGLASTGLGLIDGDPAYIAEVSAMFRRALRNERLRWQAVESATYLVRHGDEAREVIARLSEDAREPAEAALLALDHAPEMVLPLLRRALRSRARPHRLTAAAVLALFDRPWSRRELMDALGESGGPWTAAECLAALRESRDHGARAAADRWEADRVTCEGRPRRGSRGYWDSSVDGRDEELAGEMERLRERVLKSVGLLPDEVSDGSRMRNG